ncbi:MAG: flavodoxin family protein [Candidatus Bipolaricaulota bacterium]
MPLCPQPPRVLALVASPIRRGNVDLLVDSASAGAARAGGIVEKLFLNDLSIAPCQSCGPGPADVRCRIRDGIVSVHEALDRADALILGTPVYFDGPSAQLKLVIDRCNCFRPLVLTPGRPPAFAPKSDRCRPALLISVSGRPQTLAPLRTIVKGFFAWIGAQLVDELHYVNPSDRRGSVLGDRQALERASQLGGLLISLLDASDGSVGPNDSAPLP